jgi:hypothetical protein
LEHVEHKPNTAEVNNNSLHRPSFFQPKLSINQPNDVYEQEADQMADKVMRMPAGNLSPSFFSPAVDTISRKCQHCEDEEKLHRKESTNGEVHGSSELDNYVGSLGSSGQNLSSTYRQFFEPRFGQDFSNVRIHTDSVAAKSAQSINALAYTTGNNIVFNNGQYAPESDSGKRLIAHELTHVVQQRGSIQPKLIQRFTPSCEALLNSSMASAPIRVLSGAAIHTAIQEDFAANVAGAGNLAIPGASASPLRTAGLCGEDLPVTAPQIIGGRAGMGYPDLAIRDNPITEVAEIKPASWGCAADGTFQLGGYIMQGNATDPEQAAWRLSAGIVSVVPMNPATYPGKTIPLGSYTILTDWCMPGLLVYQVVGTRIPQPLPVPDTSTETNKKPVERTNVQRITTFVTDMIHAGGNAEAAARAFLQANPDLKDTIRNLSIAIIVGLVVGMLAEDILSLGTAVINNPLIIAAITALFRVAQMAD